MAKKPKLSLERNEVVSTVSGSVVTSPSVEQKKRKNHSVPEDNTASTSKQQTQDVQSKHEKKTLGVLESPEAVEHLLQELDQFRSSSKTTKSINFDGIEVNGVSGRALMTAYRNLRLTCIRTMTVDVELDLIKAQYKRVLQKKQLLITKNSTIVDKEKPKQPLSSYILFCNRMRDKFHKKHPSMSPIELMNYCGAKWRKLSDEEKEAYKLESNELRKKYLKQLDAYYDKHPDKRPTQGSKKSKKLRSGAATGLDLFYQEKAAAAGAKGNRLLRMAATEEYYALSQEARQSWEDKARALFEDYTTRIKRKQEKQKQKEANNAGKAPNESEVRPMIHDKSVASKPEIAPISAAVQSPKFVPSVVKRKRSSSSSSSSSGSTESSSNESDVIKAGVAKTQTGSKLEDKNPRNSAIINKTVSSTIKKPETPAAVAAERKLKSVVDSSSSSTSTTATTSSDEEDEPPAKKSSSGKESKQEKLAPVQNIKNVADRETNDKAVAQRTGESVSHRVKKVVSQRTDKMVSQRMDKAVSQRKSSSSSSNLTSSTSSSSSKPEESEAPPPKKVKNDEIVKKDARDHKSSPAKSKERVELIVPSSSSAESDDESSESDDSDADSREKKPKKDRSGAGGSFPAWVM